MFTGIPWCMARVNLEFTIECNQTRWKLIYYLENKQTFTKFSFGNCCAK